MLQHMNVVPMQHKVFVRYLTKYTIPSLVKQCAAQQDLTHGQNLHTRALQMGLHSDPFIASSLITMYFKCNSAPNAANLFDQLPQRDPTLWNSMLSGYFLVGRPDRAASSLRQMHSCGAKPDGHSLTILLKACADGQLSLGHGKQIHCYIVMNRIAVDRVVATTLVDMYSKCGDVACAYKAFGASVDKSVPMWNAMILGFCRDGLWTESLALFVRMRNEGYAMESATVSSVATACAVGEALGFGEGVHCCTLKEGFESDPYVSTSLLTMYGKFGLIDNARGVFRYVSERATELWNAMVSACISNDKPYAAIDVYCQMRSSNVKCDAFALSNVLSACTETNLWDFARGIHGHLMKNPEFDKVAVQSALTTMYMRSGAVEDAVDLFDSTKDRDVFVWGSMIAGFFQNKRFHCALNLFNQMRAEGKQPDSAIVATIASASAAMECLELGCQIHAQSIKSGTSCDQFVGCALIDVYSKLGLPHSAGIIFASMSYKNLVVFNSMISGYGRNRLIDESIGVFSTISRHGLAPDAISVTSVLASASSSAALTKGKMVHGYQLRKGIACDILVENALLDMYMKCGCSSYAQSIFEAMRVRNLVSWNTMISGYGSHGECAKAILVFKEMKKAEIFLDDITFVSLLSSCNHSGSVHEGVEIFESMRRDYGIVPRTEHYAILVDVLARAGRLREAYAFIQGMPEEADESVWLCLLSACRAYRDTELGEVVADRILETKPRGSGAYAQVSNFFGEMGFLDRAGSVRAEMRKAGTKKNPGCSWIEVRDRVHTFHSGDSSSPLTLEIRSVLNDLQRCMRHVQSRLDVVSDSARVVQISY